MPPSRFAFCTATASCLQCSKDAGSPSASVDASRPSIWPRCSSNPAADRQCAMLVNTCNTDVRAQFAAVGSKPSWSHLVSNQFASSTNTFESGASDFPLVRFHSASACVISVCDALALPRIAAMSVAGELTCRASITIAAAALAAFSPSLSMPGFLFAGSFTASSLAAVAFFAARSVAVFASPAPTRSTKHRRQTHVSIPNRLA
mmetsp:Transcript_6056/g.20164  ORF Transcript_6056/g.20164 Transcript_6056/m.20164 type:complete len:204 (-) Transcript_6056:1172-1783(-)